MSFKSDKWIAQNAPKEAISFLSNTVESLTKEAQDKGILFKGKEEMETEVVKEVTESAAEEVAVEPVVEEAAVEPVVETVVEQESVAAIIQKGVAEAIVVALKEYHVSTIAPLMAELAELKQKPQPTIQKEYGTLSNIFMTASDFMPAAAVSALLKKEFNITNTQSGDVVVSDAQIEKSTTIVKEKKVTENKFDSSNVLSGF